MFCIHTTINTVGKPSLLPCFLTSMLMSHFSSEQQLLFLAVAKKAELYAQHQKLQHSLNLQILRIKCHFSVLWTKQLSI